jgi:glycerol uptake facilitator-like aquaporin
VDESKERLDASDAGEPAAIEEPAYSGVDAPSDRDDGPTSGAVAVASRRTDAADREVERSSGTALGEWQQLLLPWMTRFLVGSAVVFALLTFGQLALIHIDIRAGNDAEVSSSIRGQLAGYGAAYLLEYAVLERRYHMNNVALLSRTWIKYLGFLTGMLMVFVGAIYIIGKFQEELSTLALKGGERSATMESTSPGLFVSAFGTAVIIVSIFATSPISSRDLPLLTWLPHAPTNATAASGASREAPSNASERTPVWYLETLQAADYAASACEDEAVQGLARDLANRAAASPLLQVELDQLDRYRQACEVTP